MRSSQLVSRPERGDAIDYVPGGQTTQTQAHGDGAMERGSVLFVEDVRIVENTYQWLEDGAQDDVQHVRVGGQELCRRLPRPFSFLLVVPEVRVATGTTDDPGVDGSSPKQWHAAPDGAVFFCLLGSKALSQGPRGVLALPFRPVVQLVRDVDVVQSSVTQSEERELALDHAGELFVFELVQLPALTLLQSGVHGSLNEILQPRLKRRRKRPLRLAGDLVKEVRLPRGHPKD
eukprot:scaffold736_cov254-Pinguiococcus_pyrenoidosus.AAC.12